MMRLWVSNMGPVTSMRDSGLLAVTKANTCKKCKSLGGAILSHVRIAIGSLDEELKTSVVCRL